MRSNRDNTFIHRKLLAYTLQEFKNNDTAYHRYQRHLVYKYTKVDHTVSTEFVEFGAIITPIETVNFYRVPKTIDIIGNKTFFEPDSFEAKQCIDMNYKPEDFNVSRNYIKMNPMVWDEKRGVNNKIKKMNDLYASELKGIGIRNLLPINLDAKESENQIKTILKIYQQHDHFYNHDSRKIAKWIYWSLMDHFYTKALNQFRKTFSDVPISFNLHQMCHRQTMDAIVQNFGSNVAREVFKGGSFFGKNRTVEAMQEMGIMDDRKYTSNGCFSGSRYRILSGKPTISPSGKEAKFRSGKDPDVWEGGVGNPPKGSKLLSPRKLS